MYEDHIKHIFNYKIKKLTFKICSMNKVINVAVSRKSLTRFSINKVIIYW